MRELLRARRDAMLGALERFCPRRAWSRPEGGYFLWLDLPRGGARGELLAPRRQAGVTFVGLRLLRRPRRRGVRPAGLQLRLGGRDRAGDREPRGARPGGGPGLASYARRPLKAAASRPLCSGLGGLTPPRAGSHGPRHERGLAGRHERPTLGGSEGGADVVAGEGAQARAAEIAIIARWFDCSCSSLPLFAQNSALQTGVESTAPCSGPASPGRMKAAQFAAPFQDGEIC